MNAILRWLKINPEETKLFLWVALLLFLVNVASIVLNNYAETAFLKRFGVEYLPAITAVNAVVTLFLLSSIGGLLSRLRGDRLIAWTLVVCAVFCGLLRLILPFDFSLIYPLLYILKTQFTVLLAFLFWNLANDLFSTRQAKRLFPLIASGGILGGLLGSLATPILIRITAADNLLLCFLTVAVAGAFCSIRLGLLAVNELSQTQTDGPKTDILTEFRQVAPLIKGSTLAQVLLLLTLLPNIIIPILNYQFSYVVNARFSSEAAMIDFYSYFRGAQNSIALLLSLFVGRIYGRFGLPVALMFHPLNYLLTFVGFLFQFNIFTAIYSGVSVGVLRRTINGPATATLYGLLLPKDRTILRPFLRGTVVRIGILAGSGLLLLANEFLHPRYLSLFAIIFSLAWLAAVLLLKRKYSAILINLVQHRLPEFYKMGKSGFREIFRGTDLGRVLLQRLHTARGDEAAWSAEMLQQSNPELLDAAILEKLPETDDATRLRLLPYLSEQTGDRALDSFLALIDPTKPELMVALARTVKRAYPEMTEEREQEIYNRAQRTEVKACFLGWMNRRTPDQFDRRIENWLTSEKTEDRRAAVLAIGEASATRQIPNLEQLLNREKNSSVLALALHSLRHFAQDPRVDSMLRPFLRHPDDSVRLAVIDSMPLFNDEQVNILIHRMSDLSSEVRKRAIARLEKLPHDKHYLLVAKMGTNSRWLREGLFKIAATLELEDLDVLRFSINQLKNAYLVLELADFIGHKPANAATRLALEHLEEVRQQRVHNALGVLASRDATGRLGIALRGLQTGGVRERSDSIEAFESLLDRSLLQLLLPMLDNRPQTELLALGRTLLKIKPLNDEAAVSLSLADQNWVTIIMMLECLAIWDEVSPYRSKIEQLVKEHFGAVVHTAEHALNSTSGVHEEALSCLIERINIIRKVDLFKDLTIGQLAAVAWQSEVEIHPPDQVLASASHYSRGLMLIVKGAVSFLQVHTNGSCSNHELKQIGPGDWFGAATMFGMDPPATMIVKTIGETLLIRIEQQAFHLLANQYPALALQVCTGLSNVLGDVFAEMKANHRPLTLDTTPSKQVQGSYCATTGDCNLVDYLFFLRQIDLFNSLGTEALTALAMAGKEIKLEPELFLITPNARPEGLFMVLEGKLEIYQDQQLFNIKKPGDYFGLPSLFGLELKGFTVKALSKSLLFHISVPEFRASVMDYPIIAIKACERLSRVQGHLLDDILQAHDCDSSEREKV